MSNAKGQLQFYSNGCHILNREHKIMVNGSEINAGQIYNSYCGSSGYPSWTSLLSLPIPGDTGKYVMFHLRVANNFGGVLTAAKDILTSTVDMQRQNGLGEVVKKNQLVETGVFEEYITGTRHANGRDWWVVVPAYGSQKYHFFLLTPSGVKGPFVRNSGISDTYETVILGQTCFSPDGNWFVQSTSGENQYYFHNGTTHGDGIRLFRFDRCSGELYDPLQFGFAGDTVESSGAAFSPNSRFLYVTSNKKIFQYDLWASDIPGSRITVANYDGFLSPFNTTFFQAMLAPDNKIYLTATNGTTVLHVIENPDELGLACNVNQHSFQLPTEHAFSPPNFPFFRLYDLPGSPCDSLGIDGPPPVSVSQLSSPEVSVWAYPNPASDKIRFLLPGGGGVWRVSDVSGRIVMQGEKTDVGTELNLEIAQLNPGLYFFVFQPNGLRQVVLPFSIVKN